MSFEWDFQKAEANFKKHGVRFSEVEPVFEDDYAITIATMSPTRMGSGLCRWERA